MQHDVICFAQSNHEIKPVAFEDKPRRHPNQTEKRALKAAELAKFVRAVGRPAQKGEEPNDRKRVDHSLQKKLRRARPMEIDSILRGDEEDWASMII